MNWEKKKILVTVKAYPEKSKRHGQVVCTIGITEEGEWIRLYPMPFESFIGTNKIRTLVVGATITRISFLAPITISEISTHLFNCPI